ncbi:MAG: C39 family peptidase, partial [Anaerolineae bacterium]|nr:C39 family peptidase [Anaerolineae bacterium]
MTTHKSWIVGGIVMLSLLLTGVGVGATMARPDATSALSAPAQAQTQSVTVLINEVMPKEDTGEYEWVELKVGGVYRVYLPLVLRSSAGGALSARSSFGPARVAAAGADLSGYQVTDEDGNTFTIPEELPPVPPGAFVLIVFGAGTDDYDFSDGRATLYTGAALANSLADGGDQVALYAAGDHGADTIVDFVAWTIEPGSDAANAAAAGIWQPDWFATFESGFGDTSDEDILEPDESLGRYPGGEGQVGPGVFALYHEAQLSPGQANPVPLPSFFTPEDGAVVETEGFSVSWSPVPGATGYRFQLDDDVEFDSPLYDVVISESFYQPPTPLAEGTYYWQVQPLGPQGDEGAWLGPIEIGIVVFAGEVSAQAEVVLGITPVRQNKDSRLICLDRCPEGDPTTNTREDAWDAPAPCTAPPCTNNTKYQHGRMYCVPASIRMMASHYGGDLKMDRIAYHMAQEWTGNTLPGTNDNNPNNDLAHNKGWQYHSEEDEGISWALGTTLAATGGKPSFSDIKSWIDAGRPIMFRNPGHMMVMDGYREEDGDQYIHVLDPDQPPDCWRWQDYSTQTIDGHWPGPASAPSVRSDEASVSTDTDGDGIMDFDEINRFPIGYTSADTDDDWVRDKQDMREYVFNSAGDFSYRNADWDGDGDRKEVDCDNDGDGSPDGCEDVDGDGVLDAGETDNFDAGDTQACVPSFQIAYPTHRYTLSAGAHNNPDKILIHLRVDAPGCWGLSPSPEDFDVSP